MSEVQRYGSVCGGIGATQFGNYVTYDDYAQIASELAKLKRDFDDYQKSECESWDVEYRPNAPRISNTAAVVLAWQKQRDDFAAEIARVMGLYDELAKDYSFLTSKMQWSNVGTGQAFIIKGLSSYGSVRSQRLKAEEVTTT